MSRTIGRLFPYPVSAVMGGGTTIVDYRRMAPLRRWTKPRFEGSTRLNPRGQRGFHLAVSDQTEEAQQARQGSRKIKFAPDSLLEGGGFEPLVPLGPEQISIQTDALKVV